MLPLLSTLLPSLPFSCNHWNFHNFVSFLLTLFANTAPLFLLKNNFARQLLKNDFAMKNTIT